MSSGKESGTSLLLIFAAIDLLCSAMVCGVLLTVVLIGGAGSSITGSGGEGKDVGVTLVEAWAPDNATLEIDGARLDEPQRMASSDIVLAVLGAQTANLSRSVYLIAPGERTLRLRFARTDDSSASAVAIIHSGTGALLAMSISCKNKITTLAVGLSPHITLPTCAGRPDGTPKPVREKAVVCIAPAPSVTVDQLGKSVVRAAKLSCDVNEGYTSTTAFSVPSKFGIWALLL